MPIVYRALRSLGCTISIWDGEIDERTARDHVLRLAQDSEWPPGPLHLTDLRTVRHATLPDAGLLDLLYEGTDLTEDIRVAVIVDPGQLSSPALHFMAGTIELHALTFEDVASACAYLDLDVGSVETVLARLRHEL